MKSLPPTSEMYEAILNRDTSLDGVFFVGVRTTGIFCRPGCGAKKPLRQNVEFFSSTREAMHAGYRACKRCRPLDGGEKAPEWVRPVLTLVERHDEQRLTAHDLRTLGVNPARASRYFKTHYGMTVQGFHRARRMGMALTVIRKGAPVGRTATRAGFESESGFREAFTKVFGEAPARAAKGDQRMLAAKWIASRLGPLLAAADDSGVCLLEFIDRRALETQLTVLKRRFKAAIVPGEHPLLRQLEKELAEYFAGKRSTFDIRFTAPGTLFQAEVWAALRRIPPGETRSYLQIAKEIGRPTATRAVARANGDNRLAILIPCHRVIGSDGSLTGYGGGMWRKEWLLDHEKEMTGKVGGLWASGRGGVTR